MAIGLLMVFAGCVTVDNNDQKPKLEPTNLFEDPGLPETALEQEPISSHLEALQQAREDKTPKVELTFANQEKISIEFRDLSLEQAFNQIVEKEKLNLIYEGNFSEPVMISFPEITLKEAFHALMEIYQCHLENRNSLLVMVRADAGAPMTHLFTLKSTNAQTVLPTLQTVINQTTGMAPSPEGTDLMITAPYETLELAAKYLDAVDKPEKQVVIEARLVEIVLTDTFDVGVELDFSDIHMDDTTSQILSSFLPASTDATVSITGDNAAIAGSLSVLQTMTRVEILSRPSILAKNGQEAKIEVVEEIPYIDATTTVTGSESGVNSNTVQEVEFKEVGLKLNVTPFIKNDGSVELKVNQDVSEQMDTFMDIPVVDRKVIDTRLEVKNGQTAIIGGLIKENTRDVLRGVPFLMDIPLLGYLFRSNSEVTEKRELLVMIRPYVIYASNPLDLGPGYKDSYVRGNSGD